MFRYGGRRCAFPPYGWNGLFGPSQFSHLMARSGDAQAEDCRYFGVRISSVPISNLINPITKASTL
jgi:hypothetical protein